MGRPVTWSSNNGGVAAVSPSGLVTAVAVGSATITATSEGVSGTSTITVTVPPPPPPPPQGTYYVSPTGSDANSGSATAPFRTIQRAADVVNPGDVVVVDDGVWTDDDGSGMVVQVNRGGTPSAWVTFRSRNQWGAKLDGENGRTALGFELNNGVGYVRIEGFDLYGFANVGSPVTGRGSGSAINLYDGGHDSEIIGNHIHHIGNVCTLSTNTNGQTAIFIQVPNVTVDGNVIHDIGRFFPGENGCSYSSTFRGYQTLDHGIYLNGNPPGAHGAVIRNNIFYNTRHGWGVQFYPDPLSNIQVLNNTFAYGNPNKNYTHITLHADVSGGSRIANNIFYNPEGGQPIHIPSFSGTITISDNLTTGSAMTDDIPPAGMTLTNNWLNTDPLFVNPSLGDFRLQAGSPAIDAGQTFTLVRFDITGRARPQGAAYDLGAYEY
ncbi:MAG: choice-of-anchor Q domain-containing protein [Gemmatimonadales bacterium]